uniref:Uncharacterized protein n=1 Tax=Cacopsylla melanoneura TaxID=428564 RepID=A0A8D8S721_9HEMI
MDKKNGTKKKWNHDKINAFLKFSTGKVNNKPSSGGTQQYLALFLQLLQNNQFKQKLTKCSPHSRSSLVLECLLNSELTTNEYLLLGQSLHKNPFYSDQLGQLIQNLFEKKISDSKVVEFLRTIWFDKDVIHELPTTWSLYLKQWPDYLEYHVLEVLQSIDSSQMDNIWSQDNNHFLIKMCCKQASFFQSASYVLNGMLLHTGCNRILFHVIQQFISSVREYCVQNNMDMVELYPRSVQSIVLCCTLSLYSNVKQFAHNISTDWKFILSSHWPKLESILLHNN